MIRLRPSAAITFSRLYAEDGDTVIITAIFDEDMLYDESNPPQFFANVPPASSTIGDMELVNPPETYDDFGLDGVEDNGDQGDQNGQYDIGEPFNDFNGNGVYDPDGDLFTWQYIYVPSAGQGQDGFFVAFH